METVRGEYKFLRKNQKHPGMGTNTSIFSSQKSEAGGLL